MFTNVFLAAEAKTFTRYENMPAVGLSALGPEDIVVAECTVLRTGADPEEGWAVEGHTSLVLTDE